MDKFRTRLWASVLVFAAAGLLLQGCTNSKAAPPPVAPPQMGVIAAATERVELSSEWVATLDGYVNAQIRPQLSGYLIRSTYREGAVVKKGEVLFEIDPRPFEATLAEAKARLGEAQAQLGRTVRDLQRDTPLAEQRAIAQSQLDNDIQAKIAAEAAVTSADAAIAVAQLNLGFTKVTSLIGGVAGIATGQTGDLVGPATLLTTVSQIDPIKVYFSLSEQEYLKIAGRINAPASARQPWKGDAGLTLVLADGAVYPKRGEFLAADRQIDPKTGTIRISASFPNPDRMLRPGQYGRVRVQTDVLDAALLVPQRAVAEVQGSYQLRIVGSDNTVRTRPIVVGQRVGNQWIVREGLKAGEQVVVEGPPVNDGVVVTPKPFVRPAGG